MEGRRVTGPRGSHTLRPSSAVSMGSMVSIQSMITSAANPRVKAIRELHNRRPAGAAGLSSGGHPPDGRGPGRGRVPKGGLRERRSAGGIAAGRRAVGSAPVAATPASMRCRCRPCRPLQTRRRPRGVLAVVPLPPRQQVPRGSALVVVLDGMLDPGNLGTILRTALAAGVGAVITSPGCADVCSQRPSAPAWRAFPVAGPAGRSLGRVAPAAGRSTGSAGRASGRYALYPWWTGVGPRPWSLAARRRGGRRGPRAGHGRGEHSHGARCGILERGGGCRCAAL